MSRLLALALLVAACSHTAEPATPGTGSAAPTQGSGSASGVTFAATGEDCAAATAKLEGLVKEFDDVIVANAKVLHDHRAKEMRAALEPHQKELDAAAHAIMESKTLATCSPDKRFENAFDRLMAP
jgi:hypothetical protein